jgi:hypothetical protein
MSDYQEKAILSGFIYRAMLSPGPFMRPATAATSLFPSAPFPVMLDEDCTIIENTVVARAGGAGLSVVVENHLLTNSFLRISVERVSENYAYGNTDTNLLIDHDIRHWATHSAGTNLSVALHPRLTAHGKINIQAGVTTIQFYLVKVELQGFEQPPATQTFVGVPSNWAIPPWVGYVLEGAEDVVGMNTLRFWGIKFDPRTGKFSKA